MLGVVYHLLPSDFARRERHAFALNAVVTSKENVARVAEGRRGSGLYEANLQSQTFESAKRAFGFIQIVYLLLIFNLVASV